MDVADKIEFLKTNLSWQLGWIAAAEKKTTFIFTLNSVMLGVLAAIVPTSTSDWRNAAGVFATITLIFSITSLVKIAKSTFPKTSGPQGSLIYFGGINDRSKDDYATEIADLSEAQVMGDLVAQCHRNAQIATMKYGLVQSASAFLFAALPFWLIALFLLYLA